MADNEAIESLIADLDRIPREISTFIDISKLADEVSSELQRKGNRGFSGV